ncbi:extracellular solute-binding protein [Amantichitinum ursilacus]|uniref:Multiple sugar-binding protein n=1 Tax=Amantichitinum ursilacus TaxID=857265 RepID=A0A0N0XG10_9NEIS|nr:extracellular solute-binding protein [Amantichitinum ursilacus]KPC49573.1 Multiple sugar-binding protein precursor [Amantichitinum ursilacus]
MHKITALGGLLSICLAWAAGPAHAADQVISEWDQMTNTAASKIMNDAGARFEKANPGFKAEQAHILNEAYKTKLKIAFGAGQPPCVFASWGGGPLREYVKSGQVRDLTPYLAKDPAYKDRFVSTGFNAVTIDGKIYGVPAENTTAAVIIYNKDLFARYKLSPPQTWDELLNVVKVLNANHIAAFALANKAKWPGSMYYMYLVDRIGGADTFRDAVTRKNGGSFAAPAFVEAGKRIQELVKAGAFAPGFNGLDYDVGASRRLMYSGKAAMQLMGSWEPSTIQNENPGFVSKLGYFNFPSLPGGKGDPKDVIGTVGDNFMSVSSSCKNPDAAFKLIQALTDDVSAQARLADKRVMPLKNLNVSDPYLKQIQALVLQAPSVQLWYDQELPPKLAEVHKDTVQALFGLSVTPEAAAQQMEAAAKAELH